MARFRKLKGEVREILGRDDQDAALARDYKDQFELD